MMKTSLKITLAIALFALTIASCWKRGGETASTLNDTTQAAIDSIQVSIDTTGAAHDTTMAQ